MAKLDDLNTLLDDIKAGLEAEAAKTTEIGADLDDLIALLQSGATDQALVDQAIAKATDIKAAVTAQSDTLSALAAKHDPSTT